ncbi:unnamed protein product [Effrenium voratum]|uniref:Uncharacterized protein n=1 Tax=Effrenium voratum TaxID=2562239 RepID=A0AA36MLK3_9DINO|nr:unnamed protein product [Effrenium voratum]
MGYFDPAFCDEACARDRCSNDISCQGYTLATEAINGQHAASLKGEVTGSSAWEGYTCIKKLTECACGIGSDASTSRAMVPMALALCQALCLVFKLLEDLPGILRVLLKVVDPVGGSLGLVSARAASDRCATFGGLPILAKSWMSLFRMGSVSG